jgi:hypothetical protein
MITDDIDRGREVTVPVTEFEGFDAACACEYRIVERVRSAFGEH